MATTTPVMARGGGDSLESRGDGIAEPAESPDGTAGLVREGVIDEQGDAPGEREARGEESTDTLSESRGGQAGRTKKV